MLVAPPVPPRHTTPELAILGGALSLLTVALTWPLAAGLDRLLPVNVSDPRINAWTLAWGIDRLPHGLIGFFSPPVFFPYRNMLAASENLLGIAVMVAPVQWLFHNDTLTYNAAFLLSYLLCGIGAYLLAFELTASRPAAWVAACAFAFAPYRVAQVSHLQVLSVGWMALALWALHRAWRTGSRSAAALWGIASVLQVLSNGYSAFPLALATMALTSWHARSLDRRALPKLALVLALALVVIAPAVVTYRLIWGDRAEDAGQVLFNSADLSTYLSVTEGLPDKGWLPGRSQPEGNLFPGTVVLGLAALALWPAGRNGKTRRALSGRWLYASVGAAAVLISLGPEPHAWGARLPFPGVYAWLSAVVPFFRVMRVPARFGMLAILATATLAAYGMARASTGISAKATAVVAAACCALIAWEGCAVPLPLGPPPRILSLESDAMYDWLAGRPAGAVLELPVSTLGLHNYGLEYEYGVLRHRHPIVNGMSRFGTPLQAFLGGSASPLAVGSTAAAALPMLTALGVRYVLVHPELYLDPDLASQTVQAFRGAADVWATHHVGATWAFELPAHGRSIADEATLRRVPASAIQIRASDGLDRVARMVDDDPDTRWYSGHPQQGTEWVSLGFDRPRDIGRVDFLFTARSLSDYPRDLEIAAVDKAGSARPVWHGAVLEALGWGFRGNPDLPVARIVLPPNRTSELRLRQLGSSEKWFWSIDELMVWERP